MKHAIVFVITLILSLSLLCGCTDKGNVSEDKEGKITDDTGTTGAMEDGKELISTVESLITSGMEEMTEHTTEHTTESTTAEQTTTRHDTQELPGTSSSTTTENVETQESPEHRGRNRSFIR